jgi:autotransporter-associated beta strand protein
LTEQPWPTAEPGSLGFTGANAGNAIIYVNGGTVAGAAGAQLSISNGSNAGTATVIGGSGVAGAGGGRITTDASSNAANARFAIGAGGQLEVYGFGDAQIGSLDVAGAVYLGQTGLRIGALNTSNTISGPISGYFNNGNAKITKVGTGTLTLSGANTYYGLTKVDGGTLAINGTTPGAVEVNSGAMLMGTGSIGGTVTLNSGGTLAPGASAGTLTVGGLAMTPLSSLQIEMGATAYDRIIASGNMALAGTLNVSLIDGFMPTLGNMFDLFNWGTKSGTFSAVNLPVLAAGLSWDTTQLYTTGVLSVAAGLTGDYNNDGSVDAADYVYWRKTGGPTADYSNWRTNFGQSAGGGSSAGANAPDTVVPEPLGTTLLLVGAIWFTTMQRRRAGG